MAVVVKDNKIQEVADKDVDFEIPSWPALVGTHASMVPLSSNAQTQRLFYSARFVNQAMSVADREAPLVQSLDPDDPDGLSFEQKFGRRMGARYWDDDSDGVVTAVTPDYITVSGKDGKKNINLYNRFQFNRKTYIHNKPLVKVGDKVGKGTLLASSNYTDDNGTVSMGANARVALVPYKGYSMDDAIVISQRFADRMRSQHNYEHSLQKDTSTKFGKEHYASLFPRKFTKEQLDTLDENGMVKPGTVLHKGDPIMLATRPKPVYSNAEHLGKLGKVFRTIRSDAAEVWDHEYPGTVDDVADGKKARKVFVSADVPMQLGDKLVMRNGQKGIVSKILGDNEMLRSLDGKPFDVLLNPLALPSRVNTATLYEMALGKVAAKQGKPIAVDSYTKPGSSRLREVKDLLKKNGLEATEEVFDPATGLKLERPVSTGMNYIYKLHHVVASKKSARGNAGYDINEQPMRGGSDAAQAKRLGGLETTAILAKGGYSLLKDGATIRGQKNADYWRSIRQGHKPAEPGTPFVFDKFRAMLNGAGLLARDLGKGTLRLSPLTDRDLDSRNPIEVLNGKLVKSDTLDAEKDGLFDEKLVSGNRWGKITLDTPVPNPAMEQNICLLLGIKAADMRQVIAGKMTLDEAREKGRKGSVKSASEKEDTVDEPDPATSFRDVKSIYDSLPREQQLLVSPSGRFVDSPNLVLRTVDPDKGFAEAYKMPGDKAFVTVAVAPDAQGKGLGLELLQRTIAKANAEGIGRLVYRLNSNNNASRALVRKFVDKPHRTGKDWEEYIIDTANAPDPYEAELPPSVTDAMESVKGVYKDMGYDLSDVALKGATRARYENGSVVPFSVLPEKLQVGASWVPADNSVYFHPDIKAAMKLYGVKGSPDKFIKTLVAHELAHAVDQRYADDAMRKQVLEEARKAKFTTPYLDNLPFEEHRDKEIFAEWLAGKVAGGAGDDTKK